MPIKNLLKASLAGVALLALSFTGASAAPSIPCGTAKLIVPWGAGGGTDVIFKQMVDKVNKNLSAIEQIRRFILIDHEFTIENNMMTPSMKVRRFKVKDKYKESLENLY